jgi:ribose transport system permease protein
VTKTSAIARVLNRFDYQKYSSFIALVVLFVVSAFLSPYFTRPGNLVNILSQVSYTGMIALGMAFVIISGGIDLSVGSLVAFDSLIGVLAMNYVLGSIHDEVLAIITGIAAALIMGAVTGWLNGITITLGRIAPFIVTLGTLAIFRSLALFIGNAGEIQSQSSIYGEFGLVNVLWIPVPVWVMMLLAFGMDIVLNRTRYGRHLCAVGSNTRVAIFSAIDVDRVKVIAYTITGVLVAISSVLLSSRFNAVSTSNTGVGYELDAIAAVIVGGTPLTGGRGTVWGTIVGAIILGIINNMLNLLGVSAYLQGTVKGLVIIGAVYIQRQRG